MSRLPDGREHIATLALPLPVTVVGALGAAFASALAEVGWTDCVLDVNGPGYRVIATPPAPEPEDT